MPSTVESAGAAPSGVRADVTVHAMTGVMAQLHERIGALEAERYRLTLRVKDLEQQLWRRRADRGPASGDAAHPSLFADATGDIPGPSGVEATERPASTRARSSGPAPRGPRPLDPALPRESIVLADPPERERRCPVTGEPMSRGFTQTLEVLARRPAAYYVKHYERTVWVSPAKSAPVATPWPADVLSRSRVHASIVAHVAAAHFCEHVPYYRLEQQLARTGVSLPRSSQVSLMAQLDGLVAPLVEYLKKQVLSSGYVHLDATPVDLCDPARPGEARSSTLWAYRARSRDPAVQGLVWFDYQPTKSPARPRAVLTEAAYRGVVQTDGASGLDSLGPPDRVTHLGCWAHARRYVADAVTLGEPRADWYLTQVDRLFRIEARARSAARSAASAASQVVDRRAATEGRIRTWRTRFSMPVVERLYQRAAEDSVRLPPKSALATAVGYLVNQRASLVRCVTTPGSSLDNNPVENTIRPLKLGARNWLFVGHPDAGPRLANLFTLVENARQARIDVEPYLIDLVSRLPASSIRRLADWLPRAWQAARAVGITGAS